MLYLIVGGSVFVAVMVIGVLVTLMMETYRVLTHWE